MNVVDSSCWLELAEKSPIGRKVAPIIKDLDNLVVPTIVLYEVFKKLTATSGTVYATKFVQKMLKARVVPLDILLSINAANISRKYQSPNRNILSCKDRTKLTAGKHRKTEVGCLPLCHNPLRIIKLNRLARLEDEKVFVIPVAAKKAFEE